MKIQSYRRGRKFLYNFSSWIVVIVLVFGGLSVIFIPKAHAALSGKTTLYLHKENSDINQTYNSLALTPSEPSAATLSSATSTTNFTSASPAFCESSNNTANSFNEVGAAEATSGAERCMATFISAPVGAVSGSADQIAMSTGDTASIKGDFYASESANNVTLIPKIYVYWWSGSGGLTAATNLLASWTACGDPGTGATVCTSAQTAAAPAVSHTFANTDRIVVIETLQQSGAVRSGATGAVWFDNSASASSFLTFGYTVLGNNSSNKPALTGTMDDDFTTDTASTSCTTGGVTYNTKWICLLGTASGVTGQFNSGGTSGTINGDSSGWLWLSDSNTNATVSEFGSTPSNNFLYQTLPGAYSSGNVTTVLNSSGLYNENTRTSVTPFSHSGLVLWSASGASPNYLEVQVYSSTATDDTGTNTVNVALNDSGTLSGVTSLNATTTAGNFNNIWLRFANTNGSYQAQYSTDGTSFTNVGSAVVRGAFSRVGLNSLVGINPAGVTTDKYAGAFEWFQSTLATPTYTQTSASWFANADSVTPGAVHGAANTLAYTTTTAGENVRLRALLRITGQLIAGSTPAFNLQYVDEGTGTCSSPSGGTPSTYTDVTTSTLIAYFNNPTPGNGVSISNVTGDPTDSGNIVSNETYLESNPFSPNQQGLNNSSNGKWDFSLIDNGATAGKTYCFRMVNSDDTNSNFTYPSYPTLTIFTPTGPTTDQLLRGGEWFNSGTKQPFFWAN